MAAQARRILLEDVAREAGVSRATASRVLTGSKPVSSEVAHRVRTAITTLGYVPNLAARSLMTKRTDMVALVAGEPETRIFTDPYFAAIVRGVSLELADADLQLVLSMIQRPSDFDQIETFLLAGQVDGVLVISEHASQTIVDRLIEAEVPVVLGGRPLKATAGVPYVDNDNVSGGRIAAEYLREIGRRRIGTIAGPQDMPAGVDRLAGFRRGMGEAFDERLVVYGDFTIPGGIAAAEQLLSTEPTVDAVFVGSDLMAIGLLDVLRRKGRRVPEDVAVVGFDDIDLAHVSVPPLTTVRQSPMQQGRMMVRLLLHKLGRSDDLSRAARRTLAGRDSILLPVELVKRASA